MRLAEHKRLLGSSDQHQDTHDDEYQRPPLVEEWTEARNPAKIGEKKQRADNDQDQSGRARSE
jgi:hypothetical protein